MESGTGPRRRHGPSRSHAGRWPLGGTGDRHVPHRRGGLRGSKDRMAVDDDDLLANGDRPGGVIDLAGGRPKSLARAEQNQQAVPARSSPLLRLGKAGRGVRGDQEVLVPVGEGGGLGGDVVDRAVGRAICSIVPDSAPSSAPEALRSRAGPGRLSAAGLGGARGAWRSAARRRRRRTGRRTGLGVGSPSGGLRRRPWSLTRPRRAGRRGRGAAGGSQLGER